MICVVRKLTAAVLLMAGTTSLATEPKVSENTTTEKKICKTEKITGSLTRVRRTCLTQREWDQLAEGTRREMDKAVRNAGINPGGSSSNLPGS